VLQGDGRARPSPEPRRGPVSLRDARAPDHWSCAADKRSAPRTHTGRQRRPRNGSVALTSPSLAAQPHAPERPESGKTRRRTPPIHDGPAHPGPAGASGRRRPSGLDVTGGGAGRDVQDPVPAGRSTVIARVSAVPRPSLERSRAGGVAETSSWDGGPNRSSTFCPRGRLERTTSTRSPSAIFVRGRWVQWAVGVQQLRPPSSGARTRGTVLMRGVATVRPARCRDAVARLLAWAVTP
jgi:hypothetical protein